MFLLVFQALLARTHKSTQPRMHSMWTTIEYRFMRILAANCYMMSQSDTIVAFFELFSHSKLTAVGTIWGPSSLQWYEVWLTSTFNQVPWTKITAYCELNSSKTRRVIIAVTFPTFIIWFLPVGCLWPSALHWCALWSSWLVSSPASPCSHHCLTSSVSSVYSYTTTR